LVEEEAETKVKREGKKPSMERMKWKER